MNQKTRSKPLFINKVEDFPSFRTTLNIFKVYLLQNCAFSPSNHHSLGSNTIPTYIQFYGEIDTKRNKIRTKRGQKKDEKEEKMGKKRKL